MDVLLLVLPFVAGLFGLCLGGRRLLFSFRHRDYLSGDPGPGRLQDGVVRLLLLLHQGPPDLLHNPALCCYVLLSFPLVFRGSSPQLVLKTFDIPGRTAFALRLFQFALLPILLVSLFLLQPALDFVHVRQNDSRLFFGFLSFLPGLLGLPVLLHHGIPQSWIFLWRQRLA